MSGVEAYYRAHAREFSYGRVSPLGLNAGSCGFAAMGLAMTLQHAGGVYDVLMAAGILGMLLFCVDVGVAAMVGPGSAHRLPVVRGPGQRLTFTTDRHFMCAAVLSAAGGGMAVYGETRSGLIPGSPVVVAAVASRVVLWGVVWAAKSRGLTVTVDDGGVRDDTVPFRHRVATWDRIVSASVFATTPGTGQVVLQLRPAPASAGSPQATGGRSKRLRISCPTLTVNADDLLQIITADPMFRAGHLQGADNES